MNRFFGACAVVAAACALGNLGAMAIAVDLDVARLFAFGSLVDADDPGERWLVASLWVDAGYYVALLPVAYGLGVRPVGRVAGAAYALVGAAGAVALALAWPGHFAAFDRGEPGAAEAFAATTDFVYRRVWNGACAAAGVAWWASVAVAWRESRSLAAASAALAFMSAVEGLASGLGVEVVAHGFLGPLLLLLPLWCVLAAGALGADGQELARKQ